MKSLSLKRFCKADATTYPITKIKNLQQGESETHQRYYLRASSLVKKARNHNRHPDKLADTIKPLFLSENYQFKTTVNKFITEIVNLQIRLKVLKCTADKDGYWLKTYKKIKAGSSVQQTKREVANAKKQIKERNLLRKTINELANKVGELRINSNVAS